MVVDAPFAVESGQFEVFFNRPLRPIPLERMLADMKAAESHLVVVCAWASLSQIGDAVIASHAKERLVIFSQADLGRAGGGSKALFDRLRTAAGDHRDQRWQERTTDPTTKIPSWNEFCVEALGSADFREGIMHHKFVIADGVVWTGSYNLTFQAGKNYETLMRIDSEPIAEQFYQEAFDLVMNEYTLWQGHTQLAWTDGGVFRCGTCDQLRGPSELAENHGTWMECIRCRGKAGRP